MANGLVGFGIVKSLSTTFPFGKTNLPLESFTSLVSKNLVEFIEFRYLF